MFFEIATFRGFGDGPHKTLERCSPRVFRQCHSGSYIISSLNTMSIIGSCRRIYYEDMAYGLV
jgi:hypothetical protein